MYCAVLCCAVLCCTVLSYPVQAVKDRDFQFGYNQVTTCLCADTVLFNSEYNRDSFITNIPKFLSLQPDHRPDHRQIVTKIRDISHICYFPLKLPARPASVCRRDRGDAGEEPRPLHIVWPHRHDHDKDPATFCRVVTRLHEAGHSFTLSVLGEEYAEVPPEMRAMQQLLGAAGKISAWGHLSAAAGYHATLAAADVVVSTARHETYGVAMLEAAWLGCYPLAPRALVYPELYPAECLYSTEQQLYNRLASFCARPGDADTADLRIDFDRFTGREPLQKLIALVTGN